MTTVEHSSKPRPYMVFPRFCAIRPLTCAALRFGSLLSPDHHEPLCSCSPPCLSVFLGGITHPVSFRAEDKGNCPQSGGFGQPEFILSGFARSITWKCT